MVPANDPHPGTLDRRESTGSSGVDRDPGGGRRGVTRRRILAAVGATALAGLAGCSSSGDGGSGSTAEAGEWPSYQRDSRNTGFNEAAAGPAAEPTVEWAGSSGHTDGPATFVDGVVYVGGPESVYAYDPESGEEEWSYEVGDMTDAALTVADGTVVFPSRAGKVHALSAADGAEQWVRSTVEGSTIVESGDLGIKQGSATVVDGTVYVTKEQIQRRQTFVGLDLETGDVELVVDSEPSDQDHQWATERGFESFANTPAVVDGTAYLGAESGYVYAVDLATGDVRWATELASFFGSPAVVDGTVYVATHGQGTDRRPVLYALDAASGDVTWQYELGPAEHGSRSVGSVCVAHDAVFASNRRGILHAVERADGTQRWSRNTGRRIYGAASADAERVYVGNDGGQVYALDPGTGDVQWQFQDSSVEAVDAAPTPVDGALYVTSDDRSVVALTEP